MTIAIMQPYFFPYIGYWQLIHSVDIFVIYDDVTFIKQGYINKNSLLSQGKAKAFSLELLGASSNKLINEIEVGNNTIKILKTIKQNYNKSPYYNAALPIITEILENQEKNLAKFLGFSLERICNYLQINTKILYSSSINKNTNLKAQNKIIDICKSLNATNYINSIGGQSMYDKESFKKNGIVLNFVDSNPSKYKQFQDVLVPSLSIIDIMMFNHVEDIKTMLTEYTLI